MQKLFLVPIVETPISNIRVPKYFSFPRWGQAGIIESPPSMKDYGFVPYGLVFVDMTQAEFDVLTVQPDVYTFPGDLDTPVSDSNIDIFFEGINLPTDWLTPSTTYRELLRNTAGMFEFNQRYAGIYAERYGGVHSVFDIATLNTRLRQMTTQEREIFLETVASFGYDPSIINTNSQLRLLLRQAASFWENRFFSIGGFSF